MTLRVTFLGTAGAVPTTERNPSGIHVNRDGDELLIDVGEGIQRQMMRYNTGFSISDIFLTHLHGDHVYGLPGLLETLSFNDRTAGLTIHTPRHTREDVVALATVCGTDPSFPVNVVETSPGDVPVSREAYEVQTIGVDHRTRAVGYALVEADRRGRFHRDRAEKLGVPVGPLFSRLHEGESVELEDGTVVRPDEVVGPPRPGRRVVFSGDTRPVKSVEEAASNADLLIHDATFGDEFAERAVETGHSTAREAGEIAQSADATRLVLTHISSRYSGDPSVLAREASEEFNGDVTVAHDGLEIDVPFPD